MAQTELQKVEVVELTRYGFKDGTGAYVGWSKKLDEKAKIPVVPGRTFNMELYIADSGKKYVNKVLQMVETADVPKVERTKVENAKNTYKEFRKEVLADTNDKPMTRTDWDSKDRRISRQGCIQAAVQAVSPMYSDVDALYQAAEELSNKMLEFVNR